LAIRSILKGFKSKLLVIPPAATEAAKAVAMTRRHFRKKPMAGNPAAPLTAFKRA
jgi:hypothetical protein